MAAGNSDYGSLAQGGLGQGIAQGIQQGTDNYNKGVDRKAAQANLYLSNFIGPNLARLGRAEPRPGPDASAADIEAWAQRETARLTQLQTVLGQSEKYLKETGSPLSKEEWAGLWYDPASSNDPVKTAEVGKKALQLKGLDEQRQAHLNRIAQITDPSSPLYKQAVDEYNAWLSKTGYAKLYKEVRDVDYEEVVGTPAFAQAAQKAKLKARDEQMLTAMMGSTNGDISALAAAFMADPNFDLDRPYGDTGKTGRQLLLSMAKDDQLDEMVKSGKAEDVATAIATLDNMRTTDPKRFEALPDSVKVFYNQVEAYRRGDQTVTVSEPIKDALSRYKLTTNAVVQGELGITETKQRIKIGEQTYERNEQDKMLVYGAAARDGNYAVLALKSDFIADLPEGTTPEEADRLWEATVRKPLADYQQKSDLAVKNSAANLVVMEGQELERVVNSAVKEGTFHLMYGYYKKDAAGNEVFVIDKSTNQYKNFLKAQGGDEALADGKILGLAAMSKETFDGYTTQRKNAIAMSVQNLRIATANAQSAEVDAKYAEIFASNRATSETYNLIQAKVQAEIAPAKARGELRQMMYQAVKQLGPQVMNNAAFRADFEAALGGPEAYEAARKYLTARDTYERAVEKNQLTIQGQQIKAADADEFDRMFKSPQAIEMYLSDPDKVAELARKNGINPVHALAALTQLRKENRTLSDLQARSIRFEMYARQQGIDLAVRSQNFQEFSTNREYNRGVFVSDRAFEEGQYIDRRNFEYQGQRDEIEDGFTASGLNLKWAEFDDMTTFRNLKYNNDLIIEGRNYALEVRRLNVSEAEGIRQFQAMFLTPLAAKIDIVQGQFETAQDNINKLLQDPILAKWNSTGINWVQDPKTGLWSAAGPTDPKNQAEFLRMKPKIDELTRAKNIAQNLSIELDEGKSLYTSIVTEGQKVLGSSVMNIPDTSKEYQGSVTDPKKGTQNYKVYAQNAPTTGAAALSTAVQKAMNGGYAGSPYSNMYSKGYCTTFIQGVLNDTMNIPGGMPQGGSRGALGFRDALLAKGAIMFPGSGKMNELTQADIKNLPDGTLIFQEDGTTQGHVGMVLGGVIVQSSKYADNKVRGAIGTMSASAYVGAKNAQGKPVRNFAVILPDSWYKNGNSAINNSGGGAPKTGGGKQTPAPQQPTAKQTPSKYMSASGDFTPDMPVIGALVGKYLQKGGAGVSMRSSPGGKSGLTIKTGKDSYAYISNDAVAYQAVGAFVIQYSNYVTAFTGGGTLEGSFAANRQKARQALINALRTAEFSGDIEKYVDKLIKAKGW